MSLKPFALVALLCATPFAQAQEVIAKMGNFELKTTDLKRILGEQPAVRQQAAESLLELDRLARIEILRQSILAEARSKGFDKRPEVMQQLERARDLLLFNAYVASITPPPADYPREEDVRKFYDDNKAGFVVAKQFQVAQIFISLPADADKAEQDKANKKLSEVQKKLAVKNADFAEIARTQSEHPSSAEKGGDLGWITLDAVMPEIRTALATMAKGEISKPINSPRGRHLLKLLDVKPETSRPFAEVKDAIGARLRQARAAQNEQAYLRDTLSRMPIQINQIELARLQQSLK